MLRKHVSAAAVLSPGKLSFVNVCCHNRKIRKLYKDGMVNHVKSLRRITHQCVIRHC